MMIKLCINTEKGELSINPMNILFMLASRMYTIIIMKSGTKHFVPGSLKSYLERLKYTKLFVRIHKSHGVNKYRVARFSKCRTYVKMIDGTLLPIARRCMDKAKELRKRI